MAARKKTTLDVPKPAILEEDDQKKKRSGTSRNYSDRLARGRPNRTFSLSSETDDLINRIAAERGLSRSQVVAEAVQRFRKRQ